MAAPPVEFLLRGRFGGDAAGSLTVGFLHAGTAAAFAAALASKWRIRGTRASALLAVWIAVLVSSALFGKGGWGSLPTMTMWISALLVFLLCSMSSPSAASLPAVFALGLTAQGVLSSLFAAWQTHFGFELMAKSAFLSQMDPGFSSVILGRISEGRSYGFFVYPNAFAAFLLMALPAAVAKVEEAVRLGRMKTAALYGISALVMAAGLVYSGSIGAAASLAAAFAFFVLIRGRGSLRSLGTAFAVSAVLLGVVVARRPSLSAASGIDAKISHLKRAFSAPVGPGGILLGRGPGTYGSQIGSRMPEGIRARHAHNWIAEIWVENGLAGVLALGAAVALIGLAVIRSGGPGSPPLLAGLSVGWLAWLIHSLVDVGYALPVLSFSWWALSGILAAAGMKAGPAAVRLPASLPAAGPRFGTALVLGGCLLLALSKGAWCAFWLGLGFFSAFVFVYAALLSGSGFPGRLRGVDYACLFLLAAGGAWVLLSGAPRFSYEAALKACGFLAIAWIVRSAANADGRLEVAARAFFLSVCSAMSLWAVWEVMAGAPSGRASFPSPNALAGFLLGGFGLALGSIARGKGGTGYTAVAAGALILAGILSTKSAGALAAGVLAGSALLACLSLRSGKRRLWFGAAAVGLPLAAVIVGSSSIDPLSLTQRLAMWREASALVGRHPFGVAPGTYQVAVDSVARPSITYAGVSRFSLRAEFAHNEPLQFAAEWGIPALGVAVLVFFHLLRAGWKGNLSWGLAVLAVLAHGLVDFPLRVPAIQAFLAVSFGILTSEAMKSRPKDVRGAKGGGVTALSLALVALTALSAARPGFYRLLMEQPAENAAQDIGISRAARPLHPIAHESYLREGAAAWSGMARMPDKLGAMASVAEENLRKASLLSGREWSAQMMLGRFLMDRALLFKDKADRADARRVFESAAESAPGFPQSRVWIARTWMEEREWDRALLELDIARRVEPLYLEAMVLRAYVREKTGHSADARRIYRRSLILHGLLRERGGLNEYERSLIWLNEGEVKGRLLNLGAGR